LHNTLYGGKRYWEPTRSNCHIPWKMSWLWAFSKNISSGAQYVTLRKYFSHPRLVMGSCATPPIKLKLGQQANRWGTTNSKPHDQSLWWDNQKHWTAVRSFLRVHSGAAPRTGHGNLPNYAEPKPFFWVNRYTLDFLHLFLLCRITYWAPLEMI